ncbi:hypothetical protein BU26DRAFT_518443 [Trematosphaeria pertusa]|uniref:O-methyltransferase domain-containing protein n=1 Tax=Trematosphaeria pertusa TaxID=390896 RepID=A0A6A6IIE0_9PLEO|nr:uncharacterized protein BU26DRAFT_518443 [Trematosphaeria pertusa]KAF2249947.1 hypothetical protein BU26DRAFT_518443 [Trematosphaeria pertusa]
MIGGRYKVHGLPPNLQRCIDSVSMNLPNGTKELLEKVHRLGQEHRHDDDASRRNLLREVNKLSLALETPAEAVLRIAWVQNATQATVRVATDLNIFHHLSGGPKGSADLAALTGAEQTLIIRIMNQLTAVGVVAQISSDIFATTSLSQALTKSSFSAAVPCLYFLISEHCHATR